VLDVPLHAMLGTIRFQPPPIIDLPETMDDRAFSVPNILPEAITGRPQHSPVFRYPYRDAVRALEYAPTSADGIRRVRYVNPLTGGPAMQILDCSLMQIDPGVIGGATRTNANTVCAVIEGHGETRIGDHTIQWGPNDIFTLPQWNWVSHHAGDAPARRFTVTDREVMRALGLLHVETAQAGQAPNPQT